MYLPTKMCPSPHTESFTWWIHGRLGRRESYQCIPAIRWNFCALGGEQDMDNTQHLLTAALTNDQLICK
ncbi:hypothetical protein NP493_1759g00009 [Ridgeia piscesae]|uniref:Uncharacterized protein n=1 Tax=Ridgeia piscesae TaxID=27915 RepID=A0AAD9JTK8_RIDPI|nr:hypothetical protein NP493_1759g00009 [Ridgeia piscesae]